MPSETLLMGIAQISVALLGFAGIVIVLNHRTSTPWSESDRGKFTTMVGGGVTTLFFALLPFLWWEVSPSADFVWQWSSAIGAVINGSWIVWFLSQFRLIQAAGGERELLISLAFNLFGVLVVCCLILNSMNFWGPALFLPYLVLLVWNLFCTCFFFFSNSLLSMRDNTFLFEDLDQEEYIDHIFSQISLINLPVQIVHNQ